MDGPHAQRTLQALRTWQDKFSFEYDRALDYYCQRLREVRAACEHEFHHGDGSIRCKWCEETRDVM